MRPKGRDWLGIALATAGVVGAISLAGIFIVYLVDSLGDDDGSKPATATQAVRTGPTGTTGLTGGRGSTGPGSKSSGASGSTGAAKKKENPAKIPDGQRYETYTNRSDGYSILMPKGWTKKTNAKLVGFSKRPNFMLIAARKGKPPTTKSVNAVIGKNKALTIVEPPRTENIGGTAGVVDRVRNTKRNIVLFQYHFGKSKKTVAINLGTPDAVADDNADDFRRIASSFRWL